MSVDKVRIRNAGNPVGEEGRSVIRAMNGGSHALLAEWGFSLLEGIPEDATVLDAGCGGGANLARWLQRCPSGKIHGLDFSEISVEESCGVKIPDERFGEMETVADIVRILREENAL